MALLPGDLNTRLSWESEHRVLSILFPTAPTDPGKGITEPDQGTIQ